MTINHKFQSGVIHGKETKVSALYLFLPRYGMYDDRLALAGEAIPFGKVATYGQLALLCGRPRNSRQVGYALNRGLAGEKLPAHRVVNSQGLLTGAPAFDTPDMQKWLLEGEGVEVKDGKVDLKKYGWHNTMEEAMALKECFDRLGI